MMMKRSLTLLVVALVGGLSSMWAVKMSDLKIYINPGHGGYTSNDRPIQLYPFAQNDTAGYWESTSNLYKGLHMYHILDSLGAKAKLSRIKNTEADDRSLGSISKEANDWGSDLFFSIHSNAGEGVNYLLMLYREDPMGTPRYPENVTLSNIVAQNLQTNEMSNWTRQPQIAGDVTFYYPGWGTAGLGVLRNLYVVGLLSEGGMHEHRPQAYRLMNDDYWWLEAWHFVKSIMEFYNTEDRFVTGNVAGVVYDDHNLRSMDIPNPTFTMHGRDKLAPVCGAIVELVDATGKVVQKRTTDNMFNGVFVLRNVTPGNYTLRIGNDKYYTVEQAVTVTANEVTYCNTALNMKREFPLEITVKGPVAGADGLVSCSSPIELEFNTDIDEQSLEEAFSITPAVAGYWKYADNNHSAKYIPEVSLDPDVTYTVNIAGTARTPDKTYSHPQLMEPVNFSFTTRNRSRLDVTEYYPANQGAVHYAAPTLEVRFDKTIKPTGIQNLITITDTENNKINLNSRACQYNKLGNGFGNAVLALQGNLKVGEKYTFKLSGDLRDTESLPMGEDLQFEFYANDVTDQAEAPVIETFDAPTVLVGNLDASKGLAVKPTAIKSTNPKLFGTGAVKMSYSFADTHDGEAMWDYSVAEPQPLETGDRLGMYVNGDFSNHELWVGVTAGTDTKWHKVCALTFRGWEYHEVVLDDLEAGYVYNVDRMKIVQVESPITQKGAIVLDDMLYRDGAAGGVNDIIDESAGNVNIYPIPASEVINVEGVTSGIAKMQLVNVAGAVVAEISGGTSINVSSIEAGVYLLRVKACDGKIIVSRVVVSR